MKDLQGSSVGHLRHIRCFVGVSLPVAIVQKAGELQRELRERSRAAGLKVGWVQLPNMHITLKFLAEIPEESGWAVRDLLSDRLAGRGGFRVHVRGAGAFPNRQRPRVLWVGIDSADGSLAKLASDVDSWLEEIGFDREKRSFSAHLTLGRVKGGAADVLEGLELVDFGECNISEAVLFHSVLRREGAEYRPLARFPLCSLAQVPVTSGAALEPRPGPAGPPAEAAEEPDPVEQETSQETSWPPRH